MFFHITPTPSVTVFVLLFLFLAVLLILKLNSCNRSNNSRLSPILLAVIKTWLAT